MLGALAVTLRVPASPSPPRALVLRRIGAFTPAPVGEALAEFRCHLVAGGLPGVVRTPRAPWIVP